SLLHDLSYDPTANANIVTPDKRQLFDDAISPDFFIKKNPLFYVVAFWLFAVVALSYLPR
ncbi:hypothetical protein, partial [Pseudomonas savastanoi]